MSKTTKYIAVHRVERRIDGKLLITEPGDAIDLTDAERAVLPDNAVRLPKEDPVGASDDAVAEPTKGRGGRAKKTEAPAQSDAGDAGEGADASDAGDAGEGTDAGDTSEGSDAAQDDETL